MTIIKDTACYPLMPVLQGYPDAPIYGSERQIKPRCEGKSESDYDKQMYLSSLQPLDDYDLIIVLFSGGKDSMAAYFKLIELGVPKSKMELWHHDIDGGHPTHRMDWPVTQTYVRAFANAEGVRFRVSYRENGFWGELFRLGASYPVRYEDGGEIKTCRLSKQQIESDVLRCGGCGQEELLKQYGYRMKFPAKSGDLSRRWCSAYLKISVADAVLCNLEHIKQNAKVLLVSGERRGESVGRSKYNEMELHRKNATAKANRLVHQWRAVIDYTERDIWAVLKRHSATPHPCYSCGWNRCSCMMCIFGMPSHWAGIRELFPSEYVKVCNAEDALGFTLDNNKSLPDYVGDAKSCVVRSNPLAFHQLLSGEFSEDDVYQKDIWTLPAGAFHGSAGGPC